MAAVAVPSLGPSHASLSRIVAHVRRGKITTQVSPLGPSVVGRRDCEGSSATRRDGRGSSTARQEDGSGSSATRCRFRRCGLLSLALYASYVENELG
eukprot:scaffold24334_cov60-Phaeocystis_antarctica.AAC.1